MSKPPIIAPDNPIMNGLRAAGKFIGGDDPNQIMNVGGAMTLPGSEGLLGWLGAKLAGKVAPIASNEAQGAFKPSVTSLGNLAVPALRRAAPVVETLGEVDPQFTPTGGEELFNVNRGGAVNKLNDPMEAAYQRYLAKGGAPTGAIPSSSPVPTATPTAEYAFDWPELGGPQYHIHGGPNDLSTVGAAKLKQLGIPVPLTPTGAK